MSGELVRDQHRRRMGRVVEQHHHLRQAARVEQRLAVHRLVAVALVARADGVDEVGGQRLQAVARSDDAPLECGVIGAATLRLVDVGA